MVQQWMLYNWLYDYVDYKVATDARLYHGQRVSRAFYEKYHTTIAYYAEDHCLAVDGQSICKLIEQLEQE